MARKKERTAAASVIDADGLDRLISALARAGHRVIGPTARDGAVVYEPIASAADLPKGLRDVQAGGSYRLEDAGRPAYFDTVVGPHTWKRYLYPPRQTLWTAKRAGAGFAVEAGDAAAAPAMAFFGVRPCELAAMAIHDKVFDNGQFADRGYPARRRAGLVVVVNCGRAGGTCFCASQGTGPRAETGFDLALTEVFEGGRHRFLLEVGSERGAEIAAALDARPAAPADLAAAREVSADTARHMGRKMIAGAEQVLRDNPDHPRWDQVAERCLNCANCTMVCPTCFCTTVEDLTSLDGALASRVRVWDSCFTVDFSYIHGGPIRRQGRARYRQWITHKLAHWHDQFGVSGCTGCGRCITWCPVGIDITEEARAIRASDKTAR